MAIKHEIRTKAGKTKQVSLTPMKAIRAHCLECVGWSTPSVRNCASKLCPLYPYRLGRTP
jgi:hypothetical protein